MTIDERKREILTVAIQYLDRGWTRGFLARNDAGDAVSPRDAEACSWCAVGALQAAAIETFRGSDDDENAFEFGVVMRDVTQAAGVLSLSVWNDDPDRTVAEVRSAFAKTLNAI